jgi:hypothetical protein
MQLAMKLLKNFKKKLKTHWHFSQNLKVINRLLYILNTSGDSLGIFFLDVFAGAMGSSLYILLPLHKGCYDLAGCENQDQLFPKEYPDLHKLKKLVLNRSISLFYIQLRLQKNVKYYYC